MASPLKPKPALAPFERWIGRWRLVPDGAPVRTHSSRLLPVRHDGAAAMLKIAAAAEERAGARLMAWWDGDGAARVLALDDAALLLERAESGRSLADLARAGRDAEATRILCRVAERLRSPRPSPPPTLVPLAVWFRALTDPAAHESAALTRAAAEARALLAEPREVGVLHGDLHHDNLLDFGPRGWLAIDPKGLWGERGFDLANLFRNPAGDPASLDPVARENLGRRLEIVAAVAGIERGRLLRWIAAWTGLSAIWSLGSGGSPAAALDVLALALAEIDR